MSIDLTVIWAFIIAFAVFAYVVMDGFDLGIGILFPGFAVGHERDRAMNSIAPVWDGNETWLVMGGGGLLAAFPLAYAIVLPALYAPLIAMLLPDRPISPSALIEISGLSAAFSSCPQAARSIIGGIRNAKRMAHLLGALVA